jgi:hypothetical protein
MAESKAWRQGIDTARRVKQTLLDERVLLLRLGWPSGHALCEKLDQEAGHWAATQDQMTRDYVVHATEHHIQL